MSVGANNPIFPVRPHPARVQISTAESATDGTGTLGTLFTAGSDGSRVILVRAKATGNTTAGMLRIFVTDGINKRLIDEIEVTAQPAAGPTIPTWTGQWNLSTVDLASGESMYVSTENAEVFNVFADGADY